MAALLQKAFCHLQPSTCPCLPGDRVAERQRDRGTGRLRTPSRWSGAQHWWQVLLLLPELSSAGGLVRAGLPCQGCRRVHQSRKSQPVCAGEQSGGCRARVVREETHSILGSTWPRAKSDDTPQDNEQTFTPVLPPQTATFLALSFNFKAEGRPFIMPDFSLQSKCRSAFPLRAPARGAVAGDAPGSASPAADINTDESRER